MSEDLDEFSSVTSSIFYAIKNPISIQQKLLDFSSKRTAEQTSTRSEIHAEPSLSQSVKPK
ncbi:MAG: hypothetical protein ACFE8U_03315 [Candidatus Hermodarchaeota archaeon]